MDTEPQEAPEETQDQPEHDAPEEVGNSAPGTDEDQGIETPFDINEVPEEARPHVERYAKQLQGDYTRKTQEIASERRLLEALQSGDPHLQALALEAIGVDLEGEEDDDEEEYGYEEEDFDEESDPSDERLSAIEQQMQERQYMDWLGSQLDEIEEKEGRALSEKEQEYIVALAEHYADVQGPNFEQAHAEFQNLTKDVQSNLVNSKRSSRPPSPGLAANQKRDYSKEEDRVDAMAAILDAHSEE